MRVSVTTKEDRAHNRRSTYRICFITDGGLQLGMGHVQQSTTFASVLRDKANISFLTKSDDTILNTIRESGFDAKQLQNDAAILHELKALNPDIVIFDKLDVDESLARDISNALDASLV